MAAVPTTVPTTESKAPAAFNGANGANNDVITSQPAGNAQQPAYEKHDVSQTGTQEWHTNPWDCLEGDDNLCLKSWCCTCFVYGKTATRIRDPSMATYESINKDCIMWAGAQYFGCGWVLTFLARGGIRKTYDIRGEDLHDCAFSYCCPCCAVSQHEKEILSRQSIGSTNIGYVAPPAMTANVQ